MTATIGGFVLEPNGQTLVVDVTSPGGVRPTLYTAPQGSSTHTLPATITTRTEFHLAAPLTLTVSVKRNGVEIASQVGTTMQVDVQPGVVIVFTPGINFPGPEDASDLGAALAAEAARADAELADHAVDAGTHPNLPYVPLGLADAAGDIFYATADGTWARLPKGSALDVLRINSAATAPEWGKNTRFVRKSADETVNNSVALQDDNELVFAIGANEAWQFAIELHISGGATADLAVAINGPAAMTVTAPVWGFPDSTSAYPATPQVRGVITALATGLYSGGAATNVGFVRISGTVVASATAGTVALQWAQNALQAVDTTVKAGSWLSAGRVA